MRPLLWAAVLGLCSTSLMAAPPRGFSFAYKDWEVACDNTGTCRAAGYGATMGEVSVLLTRSAGPGGRQPRRSRLRRPSTIFRQMPA